jgi:hypothetical protein
MASEVTFESYNGKGNRPVGKIVWDGKSLHAEPAESEFLQSVLVGSVMIPQSDGPKSVTAKDGELFLDGLQYKYRSSYLWASPPTPVGAGEPVLS